MTDPPDPLLEEFDKGPDELELFVRLVEQVRSAQKDYFRTRSTNALNKSKRLERELDEWLMRYRHPETKRQEMLF